MLFRSQGRTPPRYQTHRRHRWTHCQTNLDSLGRTANTTDLQCNRNKFICSMITTTLPICWQHAGQMFTCCSTTDTGVSETARSTVSSIPSSSSFSDPSSPSKSLCSSCLCPTVPLRPSSLSCCNWTSFMVSYLGNVEARRHIIKLRYLIIASAKH